MDASLCHFDGDSLLCLLMVGSHDQHTREGEGSVLSVTFLGVRYMDATLCQFDRDNLLCFLIVRNHDQHNRGGVG